MWVRWIRIRLRLRIRNTELKIILFIKTAVSSNNSLDLGPSALAAFAMVSLLNDPIPSFVFWIRSLVLLQDFAMNHYSDLPHSK